MHPYIRDKEIDMTGPYCDLPECHDPRTRLYTEAPSTGTSATDWSQVKPAKLSLFSSSDLPGFRRWCLIHALMFEGWAGA